MSADKLEYEPCISICCKKDKFYPPESIGCRRISLSTEETNISEIYDDNSTISNTKKFFPRFGKPCSENPICYTDSNSTDDLLIYLLENGTISMNENIDDGVAYRLGAEDYCLRSYVIENETKSEVSVCESYFDSDSFLYIQSHYNTMYLDNLFYTIMVGISMPFLAATFVVYTVLPELNNLHGLILRTYIACLLVWWTVVIRAASISTQTFIERLMIGYPMMASFLWLNVMCFDIWWSLPSLQGSSKEWNKKKLICYSIYAWGLSALISGYLSYDFQLNYFVACISISVVSNLLFFVLTAINLNRYEKDTAKQLKGSQSQRHKDEKHRFVLYLKLFIIMGSGWFFEIIGFLYEDMPRYLMYILELPFMTQGLTIFVLFVCTDKIKRLALKRLGL